MKMYARAVGRKIGNVKESPLKFRHGPKNHSSGPPSAAADLKR